VVTPLRDRTASYTATCSTYCHFDFEFTPLSD